MKYSQNEFILFLFQFHLFNVPNGPTRVENKIPQQHRLLKKVGFPHRHMQTPNMTFCTVNHQETNNNVKYILHECCIQINHCFKRFNYICSTRFLRRRYSESRDSLMHIKLKMKILIESTVMHFLIRTRSTLRRHLRILCK